MAGKVAPASLAAMLFVVRQAPGGALEVLLGRRNKQSRFLPGVYVPPGGRVDEQDYYTKPASALSPAIEQQISQTLPGCNSEMKIGISRALAITAVRETYEETGVVCGSLVRQSDGKEIVVPNLDKIAYIGRSVTPPHVPIRFAARIFAVTADNVTGTPRSTGELEDVGFVTINRALETLPMIDVTQIMLGEVQRRYQAGPLNALKQFTPFFFYHEGFPCIQYE